MPLEVKVDSELRGRYKISSLIGDGGFGIVWRAIDKEKGRDVAIKRMKNLGGGELETLMAEARKISTLSGHRNIVELYETFVEQGEGFLVMEYVDGKSLHDIFQTHVRGRSWLEPDEALDYFKQILDGLSFAHSHAIFHRDIKPSNILITKLGVVKLVDFGLAKSMIGAHSELGGHTEMGARTGTAAFMSPEAAMGKVLDHRTDIFSAGLVAYILLTGRHPFNHPSNAFPVVELIKDISFDCDLLRANAVKSLSESACGVINSMLYKDREQRCQSVQRVLQELTRDEGRACPKCGASNRAAALWCDQCGMEWSPVLRQPVKTQFSLNGEESHELVSKAIHKRIQRSRREAATTGGIDCRGGARL